MSSSTEVLRHARLFAAGLLLVVHARFSPFRGTVTLQANGAPLKDGELVYFIPRHRIEGRDAQMVARDLVAVFEEHCAPATDSTEAATATAAAR